MQETCDRQDKYRYTCARFCNCKEHDTHMTRYDIIVAFEKEKIQRRPFPLIFENNDAILRAVLKNCYFVIREVLEFLEFENICSFLGDRNNFILK